MKTKPELAMELAVKGMIPSNSIGRTAHDPPCAPTASW